MSHKWVDQDVLKDKAQGREQTVPPLTRVPALLTINIDTLTGN